jgi:hypothetical protein
LQANNADALTPMVLAGAWPCYPARVRCLARPRRWASRGGDGGLVPSTDRAQHRYAARGPQAAKGDRAHRFFGAAPLFGALGAAGSSHPRRVMACSFGRPSIWMIRRGRS